jgi:excisionase family DNA binding protein
VKPQHRSCCLATRKDKPVTDRLLSVEQVAERLGTTERFPRRLIEERRIEFVRVGRHVRIKESVLNAYIESRTVKPVQIIGRVRRVA